MMIWLFATDRQLERFVLSGPAKFQKNTTIMVVEIRITQ
jgi:hypothetical protein